MDRAEPAKVPMAKPLESRRRVHRHALMGCIAFAYLQHLRLRDAAARGKKDAPGNGTAEADAS